jgi:hypothetical protein
VTANDWMQPALRAMRDVIAEKDKLILLMATALGKQAQESSKEQEAPHVCGLTGTFTECVSDKRRAWRVRFSFEGETHFETRQEAQEAARAYEKIIADALHGEELAQLRAEVERLRLVAEAAPS